MIRSLDHRHRKRNYNKLTIKRDPYLPIFFELRLYTRRLREKKIFSQVSNFEPRRFYVLQWQAPWFRSYSFRDGEIMISGFQGPAIAFSSTKTDICTLDASQRCNIDFEKSVLIGM